MKKYLLAISFLIVKLAATDQFDNEQVKNSVSAIVQEAQNTFHSGISWDCAQSYSIMTLHEQDFAQPFMEWVKAIAEKGKEISTSSKDSTELCINIISGETIELRMQSCILEMSLGALKKLSLRELAIGIAHELGHFFHNDIERIAKHLSDIYNRPMMQTCSTMLANLVSLHDRMAHRAKYMIPVQFCMYQLLARPMFYCLQNYSKLLLNPFSRYCENEADEFAALLIQDPEALDALFYKMMQEICPTFKAKLAYECAHLVGFAEHPHFKTRIKNMKKIMQENTKQS